MTGLCSIRRFEGECEILYSNIDNYEIKIGTLRDSKTGKQYLIICDENDEEINIVLARVFSLNPNNHLLWNNHLLGNNYWATGEDETFDDTIWNVLISLDGDVYVKNCAPGKHGWEHFDPDGNDCGMISNIEVKALKSQKQIGFPIAYETDKNGQNLAVTLDI